MESFHIPPGSLAHASPVRLPVAQLERAQIVNGNLEFETSNGISHAVASGCFLVKAPEGFDPRPGERLCRNFFRQREGGHSDNPYRGFRELGTYCFDRQEFQVEQLRIERADRRLRFPDDANATCDALNAVSVTVLRSILRHVGCPEEDWMRVTGGASENDGTHWLVANYYHQRLGKLGCQVHRDTGFTTTVYLHSDGLEACIDHQWVAVRPEPGYLVVNFGMSLETLTRRLERPVKAILHRVALGDSNGPASAARISLAAFSNPPTEGFIYQYGSDGVAVPLKRVSDFLKSHDRATWGVNGEVPSTQGGAA